LEFSYFISFFNLCGVVVVIVDVQEARRRVFEASGQELDTRPHNKEVLQRTGYLVANWKKTEAEGQSRHTLQVLCAMLAVVHRCSPLLPLSFFLQMSTSSPTTSWPGP
jgi:hypothetical protein